MTALPEDAIGQYIKLYLGFVLRIEFVPHCYLVRNTEEEEVAVG